ncbi:hypothetical protein GGS21DRAFT_203943 [Xylaria nigripes]|nr:hypothetical protein GGS21DRAFT_203943 [Xylaria nigripes]
MKVETGSYPNIDEKYRRRHRIMRGLSKPGTQLMRLYQIPSVPSRVAAPISAIQCRHSSHASSSGIDFEAIRAEMLARPPQIHHDMMYGNNSHLLMKTLSDFLPEECSAKQMIPWDKVYRNKADTGSEAREPPILPAGHHLAYFPLHLRNSELCPDGTDPYHSPRDTPFTRRVWAGASIHGFRGMALDDRLAVCIERIADVAVRGPPGAEKIFVEVLREYTTQADFNHRYDPHSMLLRPRGDLSSPRDGSSVSSLTGRDMRERDIGGITERRNLAFMREPSDEEKAMSLTQERSIVKAPNEPAYSATLTPTPTLLFHYSALTYNAHRVHLDRAFCRDVEGHRDLLVHGPLCLTLMLSILQSRLAEVEFIDNITCRNLAPLYVNQAMRICVARRGTRRRPEEAVRPAGGVEAEVERNKWDVWIENQDGGLCVRGTAETVRRSILPS